MHRAILLMLPILLASPVHAGDTAADAPADMHVVMYKSPTCGCCEKWADHLVEHGFTVESRPMADMNSIKDERHIPMGARSCHTAHVGDYIVEGHVPADDILRLLKDKSAQVRILAVPAMPLGSPGMEHPQPQPFRTFGIADDGTVTVFAEHAAGEDFSAE